MSKATPLTTIPEKQVLVPREEGRVNYLGGTSAATLYRLEKRGVLKPIKLTKSKKARVFYTRENLIAAARGV